eukprot:CAMPEP_0119273816 /NCGR_PEP_ID=MMETSP1329-20130426/10973_1 /TAXON_ID=114041 /ORGANISM="Genus nov. species nov., Strain RCC1024" /LENGTH=222 /DNA_ID=CAMNT_0007274063 /DNA_START=229 /DNA_END=894 /DNA_ORIENTATION=+
MAAAANVRSDDYYRVLGVPKEATEDQIKKAYRKLAVKWHPDKNPGNPEAEEMFKRVAEAYDCLADRQKRAAYDAYGKDGARSVDQGGSGMAPHGGVDPEEIFRQMFGGGFAGGGANGVHFQFGGFPGNGAFYVNGVPVGGRRRQQQRPQQQQAGAEQIQLPAWATAVLQTVPPQLLVLGLFAGMMLFMTLAQQLMSVFARNLQVVMPILWFAPPKMKMPLLS